MSTESERIAALEKGFKDAQAASEANFDPMKGRTYIARMSPAMKRMIVEAIKKGRTKRAERKEAEAKRESELRRKRFKEDKGERKAVDKAELTIPSFFPRYNTEDGMPATSESMPGMGEEFDLSSVIPDRERDEIERIERLPSGTPEKELAEGSTIYPDPSRRDRRRSRRAERKESKRKRRDFERERELDETLSEDFPDLSLPKRRTLEESMREYQMRLGAKKAKEDSKAFTRSLDLEDRYYKYGGKILKKYRR